MRRHLIREQWYLSHLGKEAKARSTRRRESLQVLQGWVSCTGPVHPAQEEAYSQWPWGVVRRPIQTHTEVGRGSQFPLCPGSQLHSTSLSERLHQRGQIRGRGTAGDSSNGKKGEQSRNGERERAGRAQQIRRAQQTKGQTTPKKRSYKNLEHAESEELAIARNGYLGWEKVGSTDSDWRL